MHNQKIGQLGEQIATQFLLKKNHRIITTNYHSRYGEIDLISIHNKKLIFIEVKTRISNRFGTPLESITYKKRQRMLKTALHFINNTTQKLPFSWSFHLVAIQLNKDNSLKEIHHIKNILNG